MKNFTTATYMIAAFLLLAAAMSNCSTVNPDSPFSFIDETGRHPDGWVSAHGPWAAPDGNRCTDCHGSDLTGGVSGVSCSTDSYNGESCHSAGPAFHPSDWLDSSLTGNDWHGDAYINGLMINGLDCVDCHAPPPLDDPSEGKCIICHFTSDGSRTPGGWTHADNHSQWAGSPEETVCIACHEVNISFGNQPVCHNCHGTGSGTHPDPDWAERAQHGVAAKQNPGTMSGFSTCAACHGDDFNGGSAGVSCLTVAGCHQVAAPHPDGSSWRGESTPTHTNTDRDNAPECALCHQHNAGTPDCFNNTLCHGNAD